MFPRTSLLSLHDETLPSSQSVVDDGEGQWQCLKLARNGLEVS